MAQSRNSPPARTRSCQSSRSLPEGLIRLGSCAGMMSLINIAHLSRRLTSSRCIQSLQAVRQAVAAAQQPSPTQPICVQYGNW